MGQPPTAGAPTPSADSQAVIIEPRAPFVDERGTIHNLLDVPLTSIAVIRSVAGAVRANHYHKTDWHYCWLQSGGLVYAHRPVGSTDAPQQWVIRPGQIFYTPPMYEHVMRFTDASVMLAFAKNNREMANYEADTVRIAPLLHEDPAEHQPVPGGVAEIPALPLTRPGGESLLPIEIGRASCRERVYVLV